MSETIFSNVDLCPKCRYANPTGSKFCMQCGAKITSKETSSRGFKLIVKEGKSPKEFPITGTHTIGASGDIQGHKGIAAKACDISLKEGKIFLSANEGTSVYTKLIPGVSIELKPGDDFIIDGVTYTISLDSNSG